MAAPLYVTQSGRLWHAGLILIVTVGLPGEQASHGGVPLCLDSATRPQKTAD
jgi:6-phosphofructo-2-kinase/fructose-2,6-biphosphatase 4